MIVFLDSNYKKEGAFGPFFHAFPCPRSFFLPLRCGRECCPIPWQVVFGGPAL